MSYRKRQETVKVYVRVDKELEEDLRILYSLSRYEKERKGLLCWNDFIADIFTRYISSHSGLVIMVRGAMSKEDGEREE